MTWRPGIVVTGGSSGIGLGIALAFARSGADLLLVGRDLAKLAEAEAAVAAQLAEGAACRTYSADLSDPVQIDLLFEAVPRLLPGFNVLVANAGIGRIRPFLEVELDDLREAIDLNVVGTFLACRNAARLMERRLPMNPSIVVVSSIRATGPRIGRSVYSATKAALNQMVRTAALELAASGIRINAVSPGITETPLAAANGTLNDVALEIPLGRAAAVEEVAAAVLFLAGESSGFTTGTILTVDGGESLR
jgi:glucose 1-dehydrogenase